MEERTTIRLNEYTVGILEQAMKVWPECKGNRSEAIRRVMADWDRIRNENGGGKSARIEKRIDSLEQQMIQMRSDIAALTAAVARLEARGT